MTAHRDPFGLWIAGFLHLKTNEQAWAVAQTQHDLSVAAGDEEGRQWWDAVLRFLLVTHRGPEGGK